MSKYVIAIILQIRDSISQMKTTKLDFWGSTYNDWIKYSLSEYLHSISDEEAMTLKRKNEGECRSVMSNSLQDEFSKPNTGMGSLSLLQEIFPTQGTQVSHIVGG